MFENPWWFDSRCCATPNGLRIFDWVRIGSLRSLLCAGLLVLAPWGLAESRSYPQDGGFSPDNRGRSAPPAEARPKPRTSAPAEAVVKPSASAKAEVKPKSEASLAASSQASSAAAAPELPAVASAQTLFASAKPDLLTLRVLTRNGHTQTGVGSGFIIGTDNLAVTNYHVVAPLALDPLQYFGEYLSASGAKGRFQVVAIDVRRDLAVIATAQVGTGFFVLPSSQDAKIVNHDFIQQGESLYSLGNPLDLGAAIVEGTYNGLNRRGFYPQYLYSGPVNAGMSGGPSLTAAGAVAGVNVARRVDGQLVSFLVPVVYAAALYETALAERAQLSAPVPLDAPGREFRPSLAPQLLAHQAVMADTLRASAWQFKPLGPFRVPVMESDQVRCWGQSQDKDDKNISRASIECHMESAVFVDGELDTGTLSLGHSLYHNKGLHPLQFAQWISKRFDGQVYSTADSDVITQADCREAFVQTQAGVPQAVYRVHICVEAYLDFPGLYDFTLISASSQSEKTHLQSHFSLLGVSYATGQDFLQAFLAGLGAQNPEVLP